MVLILAIDVWRRAPSTRPSICMNYDQIRTVVHAAAGGRGGERCLSFPVPRHHSQSVFEKEEEEEEETTVDLEGKGDKNPAFTDRRTLRIIVDLKKRRKCRRGRPFQMKSRQHSFNQLIQFSVWIKYSSKTQENFVGLANSQDGVCPSVSHLLYNIIRERRSSVSLDSFNS